MDDILTALDEVLAARKQASAEDSYVASLNAAGLNKILEKVGEETTEVILAAKDSVETGNTEALLQVLDERMGLSGLAEKAGRKGHNAGPDAT